MVEIGGEGSCGLEGRFARGGEREKVEGSRKEQTGERRDQIVTNQRGSKAATDGSSRRWWERAVRGFYIYIYIYVYSHELSPFSALSLTNTLPHYSRTNRYLVELLPRPLPSTPFLSFWLPCHSLLLPFAAALSRLPLSSLRLSYVPVELLV
jgi:hypothetical protein